MQGMGVGANGNEFSGIVWKWE